MKTCEKRWSGSQTATTWMAFIQIVRKASKEGIPPFSRVFRSDQCAARAVQTMMPKGLENASAEGIDRTLCHTPLWEKGSQHFSKESKINTWSLHAFRV